MHVLLHTELVDRQLKVWMMSMTEVEVLLADAAHLRVETFVAVIQQVEERH